MTRPLVSGLLFAALAAGTLAAADITLLSGKTAKGELIAADAQFVTIKTNSETTKFAVKEMATVELGPKVQPVPAGTKFDELELTDGSVFRHTDFKLKAKVVEIAPFTGGAAAPELELPMSSVFFLCRDAHDVVARERWRKLLSDRGKRDLIVSLREDRLDPEVGTVLQGTAAGTALEFVTDKDEKVTRPLTRASGGLVFSQPPAAVIPPTVCKVFDVFGNVLYAQAVTVQGTGLTVKTVAGATVKYKTLDTVSKLDFSQGNVSYLSDLEATVLAPPAAPDEVVPPFMKDKVFGNTPLRLGGKTFSKGLWVFPETTLTYKLNGDYREFKAVIGIDDEGRDAGANSKAVLVVTADGRELLRKEYGRKGGGAEEVVLNVKDVKELKIAVTRDGLFVGSHLDLAEARLQK